jgi:hypothetical protein
MEKQSLGMPSYFQSGIRAEFGGCGAICIPIARRESREMADWFKICASAGEDFGGRYSSRGGFRRQRPATD